MPFLGEVAALITSICFTAGSTFFTLSGRRIGSLIVNRLRLVFAGLLLLAAHWAIFGQPLPVEAGAARWAWLGISGIIGLVLGDLFLFQAYVWIGPRTSMLLMSLVPVITTLLAWIFLAERLTAVQIIGILVTLAGVTWVILERNSRSRLAPPVPNYFRGVLFGLGGALGQALGLITARFGLVGDFSPLSGNLIRMLAAVIVLWAVTLLGGKARETVRAAQTDRRATGYILAGAVAGPFLGVSFSLLAIQRTAVGVASTLMSLPPVFLIPVGYLVFEERFSWASLAGTLVALAGVAILFLA